MDSAVPSYEKIKFFFASGPLAGASLYNRLRSLLKINLLHPWCLQMLVLSCVFIFRLLAVVYAILFLLKIELHHDFIKKIFGY